MTNFKSYELDKFINKLTAILLAIVTKINDPQHGDDVGRKADAGCIKSMIGGEDMLSPQEQVVS